MHKVNDDEHNDDQNNVENLIWSFCANVNIAILVFEGENMFVEKNLQNVCPIFLWNCHIEKFKFVSSFSKILDMLSVLFFNNSFGKVPN